MSKKVRRVVRQPGTSPPRTSLSKAGRVYKPPTKRAQSVARKKGTPILRTPTEAELHEEYGYVVKDLRRVFFLALSMFILLIVLNLVLR